MGPRRTRPSSRRKERIGNAARLQNSGIVLRRPPINTVVMASTSRSHDSEKDEEEYVLLDLNAVSEQVDIQPNAPYVLSGLDTMNPTLIINNNLKLVGKYEETIGTCLVFSETDATPVIHEEMGPSEANLFSGKCIIDPKQSTKQVKPVARLHKILKFRLAVEADGNDSTAEKTSVTVNT